MSNTSKKCPLESVDNRLRDSFCLWHKANDSYFEPESFRVLMQNLIQTLRTVTFILQKNKHVIPEFDTWYSEWQSKMSSDAVMRWLIDARNTIEKQGDLEKRSFIKAEVIASYLNEGPVIEVESELSDKISAIFANINQECLEQQILKYGSLRIERKWVANTLPDIELMKALSYAYDFLRHIVTDAHKQLKVTCNSHPNKPVIPCMAHAQENRSVYISLSDGKTLNLSKTRINFDPNVAKIAARKYNVDIKSKLNSANSSYEELAEKYFSMAQNILIVDSYYLPFIYLLKDGEVVHLSSFNANSPQQKYLALREFARQAHSLQADAVMIISEAWYADKSKIGVYERPAESSQRKEMLSLMLDSKNEGSLAMLSNIERFSDEKIKSLGDIEKHHNNFLPMMAPFYEIWEKEIPQEWRKA